MFEDKRWNVGFWFSALVGLLVQGQVAFSTEAEPTFLAALENYTVTPGRDVVFTCQVEGLARYRVAWIKSDAKVILALHTTMVAVNHRLSVTYNGYNTWKLYIQNVQLNDSGTYMCQINTSPMRNQVGRLDVVIPPDIEDTGGGSEGEAIEGGTILLSCRATGLPSPIVTWKRPNNTDIVLRFGSKERQVKEFTGDVLELRKVQRSDMGIYFCIARNGIPPVVSRTYHVHVHFQPSVKVANQLVGAPMGSTVTLQCFIEASPKSMNSWFKTHGNKLLDSQKHDVSETSVNSYSLWNNLTIKSLSRNDFGGYVCSAANALGRVEATVRLHELKLDDIDVHGTKSGSYYYQKPPANISERGAIYFSASMVSAQALVTFFHVIKLLFNTNYVISIL